MNILIIEDNKEFAYKLKNDLYIHFTALCDRTYFDVLTDNFSRITLNKKYDIIFLDIVLQHENGILIAKQIKEQGMCNIVIFISAHAHLIHESLIVHPYFFLRKSDYDKDLMILFDLLGDSFNDRTFISLKHKGKTQVIQVNDIIYVEALNHNLIVYTIHSHYLDSRLLKNFLTDVCELNFLQIHKSFVINLDFLLSYSRTEVSLTKGINLPIGRTYKQEF
ncbi:LytTR family transcriptional regulator DNA-binding domain-containing protein [Clostridioides difficile]|nr:LytTR family transcriptional regulator DNA-binding domain-containing protein [Clostridioides difficile]